MSNQTQNAPFLDVRSFVAQEAPSVDEARATTAPAGSPFLSVYEIEEGGAFANPQDEEFIEFVNELQDEEFDEALFELVNEAAALADSRLSYEQPDPMGMNYKIERALEHHFDPLVSEAEAMFAKLATELGHRDVHSLTEEEIETLVDQHRPSVEFNPAFENFWGKLKKTLKKVAGKAVKLARKGVSLAAKLGLGPILYKLRALIKPLLRRVLQAAIRKLPTQVQPYATKLAERLGFLKGTGNTSTAPSGTEAAATTGADAVPAEANAATADVSEIQQELGGSNARGDLDAGAAKFKNSSNWGKTHDYRTSPTRRNERKGNASQTQ